MKWLIAKYILFPLTIRNFKERILGRKPDKWYWADKILLKWGYFIKHLDLIKRKPFFVLGKLGRKKTKMRSRIFRFIVRFSIVGDLEIVAKSPEEAEDIIRNMSDHEIEHLTEYSFENIEITEEPILIN